MDVYRIHVFVVAQLMLDTRPNSFSTNFGHITRELHISNGCFSENSFSRSFRWNYSSNATDLHDTSKNTSSRCARLREQRWFSSVPNWILVSRERRLAYRSVWTLCAANGSCGDVSSSRKNRVSQAITQFYFKKMYVIINEFCISQRSAVAFKTWRKIHTCNHLCRILQDSVEQKLYRLILLLTFDWIIHEK